MSAITRISKNSNGEAFAVFLSDGQKITIGRDKGVKGKVWLEISRQAQIKPMAPPVDRINYVERQAFRQEPDPQWSKSPPTEQGWYWHWVGDPDCAPVPISVLWSGSTNSCFVSAGQLGITHAIDCDKYGGWWTKMWAARIPEIEGVK